MKMHNVLGDVFEWLKREHETTSPTVNQLAARFEEAWRSKGATEHGYAEDYSSRLFLDRQVPTTASYTWTTRVIAGETWWVVSFNGVPGTLPWTEILANHVRALQ